MITCLTNKIGLTGCGGTTPVSGLYINSLPGISLKSIEYVADSEQKNYLGVYDDIQVRAQGRILADVYHILSKRYSVSLITQSIDTGTLIDTTVTRAQANEYRGFIFDLDPGLDNTQVNNSSLQNHYIQSIQFYSPAIESSTDIKVIDVDTNVVLDTFSQSFVVGWNAITTAVNKTYSSRRIFIGVNSNSITSIELEIPSTINACLYGNCTAKITAGYVTVGAALSTFTETNNSYGLSVKYGVRCKYDNVICNNLDVFYLPFWYLLGSELMMERLNTERINQWTVNRDAAEKLKAYYDTEYERIIKQVCESINLDDSDCCLSCGGEYTIKESSSFFASHSHT